MRILLNKIARAIDYLLIKLFSLFPVNSTQIVLMSTPDFSDNAWAFYDYMLTEHMDKTNFTMIWLVSDPKLFKRGEHVRFIKKNAIYPLLIRDYYLATSKFVVFTHGSPLRKWRKKQVFIHTTHSASQLKAAKPFGHNTTRIVIPDFKLRCGNDGLERMMSSTGLTRDKFVLIGMPRLDILYKHKDCLTILYPNHKYNKVVIALETFKQNRNWSEWQDSSEVNPYGLNIIHSVDEIIRLNEFLHTNDTLLIIKPHPLQSVIELKRLNLTNCCLITDDNLFQNHIQLYELIENCDILLTDFSSVYYDYLLLDRPIGFMISDMEYYQRGFIIDDPVKEMPGEHIRTEYELEAFLKRALDGNDGYSCEREKLINSVFKYTDNHNCDRLFDFLQKKGF